MKRLFGRVAVVIAVVTASVLAVPVGLAGAVVSGPASQDQAFVRAVYNDYLDRDPSAEEMAAATSVSLATQSARANVVSKVSKSPYWIQVTVDLMYLQTLGRVGDQGGVDYWVGMISSGQLSVARVAASMYSSPEYFSGFGGSDVRTWVRDLYLKILVRSGDDEPSGVNYWVATTMSHGRYAVAYAFYQSNESRHTRVKTLYGTLLGRTPDQKGWDFWAQQVKTQGDLALAASLAASPEYYSRAFSRYGHVVPAAPTAVRAVNGDGQSIVSWNASTSSVGNQVTSYTVTASPGNQACTTSGELVCDVKGLTNGTSYSFSVTATSAVGVSSLSEAVTADQWHILKSPQNPDGSSAGYRASYAIGRSSNGSVLGWGQAADGSTTHALIWPSLDAVPTVLHDAGYNTRDNVQPTGISATGVVIGNGDNGMVWSSATATPIVPKTPVDFLQYVNLTGISADGTFVGYGIQAGDSNGRATDSRGLVWTSPSATPTVLQAPGLTGVEATGISPTGTIVGYGYSAGNVSDGGWGYYGLMWESPNALPTVLKGGNFIPRKISSTDVIVGDPFGTTSFNDVVWKSPAVGSFVPPDDGLVGNLQLSGVSSAGVMIGYGNDPTTSTGVSSLVWAWGDDGPGSGVTMLTPPSGYDTVQVGGISPGGTIVGSVGPQASAKAVVLAR